MLGIATSILASVVVAATALEREEFAQGILDLGVQQIFHDRLTDIDQGIWTQLLRDTRGHFRVLGMANHGYLSSNEAQQLTAESLRTALGRPKVEVEFLWLNPNNDAAMLRESEEGERGLRRDICTSIVFFWGLRKELPREQAERFSMREYNNLPTCGLTWSDHFMVVTHYLAGELNLRAPGLVLTTSLPRFDRLVARFRHRASTAPALAGSYSANYQEIASDTWSRAVDDERVAELEHLRGELVETQKDKRSEAELRQGATKAESS